MATFIGRDKELKSLQGLLQKKTSSLVVVRGRWGIGKSRLAKEYASSFPKAYIRPLSNLRVRRFFGLF